MWLNKEQVLDAAIRKIIHTAGLGIIAEALEANPLLEMGEFSRESASDGAPDATAEAAPSETGAMAPADPAKK